MSVRRSTNLSTPASRSRPTEAVVATLDQAVAARTAIGSTKRVPIGLAVAGRSFLIGAALPVSLALGWELMVRLGLAEGRLVPPPSRIAEALWLLSDRGELFNHIAATLGRVAAGFAMGAIAGIVIGAIAGYSALFRSLVDPSIQGLRAIPSLAWVPLFILWLGIFEESKIALIAVGVFFPVYLGVTASVLGIDRKIVEVGRIFRLKGYALVRRILVPAIVPIVVAAEIMGASEGLGYLLVDGQQLGKPDQIVAAIIVFALVGKITDALLVAVSAPFLRWQDSFGSGR
jgi:sulfonate transport system permease protein